MAFPDSKTFFKSTLLHPRRLRVTFAAEDNVLTFCLFLRQWVQRVPFRALPFSFRHEVLQPAFVIRRITNQRIVSFTSISLKSLGSDCFALDFVVFCEQVTNLLSRNYSLVKALNHRSNCTVPDAKYSCDVIHNSTPGIIWWANEISACSLPSRLQERLLRGWRCTVVFGSPKRVNHLRTLLATTHLYPHSHSGL